MFVVNNMHYLPNFAQGHVWQHEMVESCFKEIILTFHGQTTEKNFAELAWQLTKVLVDYISTQGIEISFKQCNGDCCMLSPPFDYRRPSSHPFSSLYFFETTNYTPMEWKRLHRLRVSFIHHLITSFLFSHSIQNRATEVGSTHSYPSFFLFDGIHAFHLRLFHPSLVGRCILSQTLPCSPFDIIPQFVMIVPNIYT